jgi:hypothetical protein
MYSSSKATRPQYHLEIFVDISKHTLSVEQVILYPNTGVDWLENIRLVVEPNWVNGNFILADIAINKEKTESYHLLGGYLDIPLETPLTPGCAVEIDLSYALSLPHQQGLFGYTADQIMLTNWYPFIPPYNSNWKWQTNTPSSYGEHLVYPLADFLVSLEFKEKGQVIQIAAPVPPVEEGEILNYSLEGARTFSLAILPKHSHISRSIGGTTYNVYYLTAEETTAQAALATLIESVATFESLFGAYPFDSLTVAEINMFDGMEYDGIFFLGREIFSTYDLTPRNIFTLLVAHETAHNWWFSQVGSDQALEPWLDESLATYSELLFLEHQYPELVDWWWDNRILYADPFGPVNVTIYDYYEYEHYRQAVYLRGALFLQAIRDRVGDRIFFEFLKQYYADGQYRLATAELFFKVLDQVTIVETDSVRWQYFAGR